MQYILSQDEYDALTADTADSLLRETNTKLKLTVDELQSKLSQVQPSKPVESKPVESKFDSPFIAAGNKLCLRNYTDFIVLYNGLAKPNLTESDKEIYDYTTKLAEMFNYEPQFESQKELKAYRVSLQKKNAFTQVLKEGRVYLDFIDKVNHTGGEFKQDSMVFN